MIFFLVIGEPTLGVGSLFYVDSFGQFIRENNEGLDKTFIYSYNGIGNITSVKTYAYTTAPIPGITYTEQAYGYNNTSRPDRLTSFGINSISYDSMGCPTSVGNKKYVWDKGRLVRIYDDVDENDSLSSEDIRFTYNAYGQRISKTYSYDPGEDYDGDFLVSSTTTYTYDNIGRLIREYCTESYYESDDQTREFIYLYDDSGMIGVMYSKNGSAASLYYYDRNHRGDVIAIYDSNGNRKSGYAYDAYGNCTVTYSGDLDLTQRNPIRYRGYYYDRETGLYYLNARYYNPQWRRFISPDSPDYLDPESVNGLNLYAYCNNDPVNYADPSGNYALSNSAKWIIGSVTFALAITLTALTGGALLPAFIGMASGIVLGGIAGGINSYLQGDDFWSGFADGSANGALWGGISALGGAILRTIKMFKYGVAIGENMKRIKELAKAGHQITYNGLPGMKIIQKVGGEKFARHLLINHNKNFIERMMRWGVKIVDYGIDITRSDRSFYYLMEIIVTKGYTLLQIVV